MKIFDFKSLKLAFLIGIHFLKRSKALVGLILLITVILFIAQFKFSLFVSSKSVREGFIGTYQEHNIPLEVTKLLSQGLVEADGSEHIKPKLVSGWETNNDATQFKFKLKDNLKWSDGTSIKSSDLDFGIPNTEVSFPDDKTIQFKLKEAYSPFPSLLTRPIFKKGTLIGTGPYQLIALEKSRVFITKLILSSQREDLPKLEIRFYPNEKVGKLGFNLGEVQILLGLSDIKSLGDNPQIKTKQKKDFTKIVTILYNTKDNFLSNRSLRQALSFITPKMEGEEEANNPFTPSSWAKNIDAKKYLNNSDEAKAAMERAKANISEDKLNQELILTTTPNLEEVGQKVVSAWKSLGFNAKVRVESGIPQNFQSLLITQSIPVDPDQYFLWHSSQDKTNLTKYSSVRVDKDLEDGRKNIKEEDRRTNYFDFQRTLLEDAPATFLYFPKYNIVYFKKAEPMLDKILSLQI